MVDLNPNATVLEEEGAFAVSDRAAALAAQGRSIINLGIGQPDFHPPTHVLEAAERAAREGPHGYTSPVGMPVLREAVAAHVSERLGIKANAGEVIIVPGGKVTIFFACALFGGPGTEILYPDPGFPPYREAARFTGAKAIGYPIREENDFAFDAEEVLSMITPVTRLIILNSPANPTGGVVPKSELDKLAEGLLHHPQVAVLSDEIYSQQIYDGGPASLMQVDDLRDRVVLLDGWSKTFAMTGWRLGYGVWPSHLIDHVRKLITINHSCVNGVAQTTALAAITGPWAPIDEYREIFKARREVVVERLNALPGVTCRTPGGAFYAFPNIKQTGWSSLELASRLLEEAGVALMHGESFGDNGAGYLRVSYAASTEEINAAMDRIEDFLANASPA